jgi:hypothetical protein
MPHEPEGTFLLNGNRGHFYWSLTLPSLPLDASARFVHTCFLIQKIHAEGARTVPCGRKRKRKKIATHKRKKKLRKNRHKKRIR